MVHFHMHFALCFQPMDMEGDVHFRPRTGKAAAAPLLPEVEAYLQLLVVVYLTNNKRYTEVRLHCFLKHHSAGTAMLLSACTKVSVRGKHQRL